LSKIICRPLAKRDLLEIFRHYARQAGIWVADRFFVETESTFARLAKAHAIGVRFLPDEPLYVDVRYFRVSRFRLHLVFYRRVPGGIEVLRVLDGARDIHGILAEELCFKAGGDDIESLPAP
jgi:toxin ParE1/3/4